jgi:hypothetical protein
MKYEVAQLSYPLTSTRVLPTLKQSASRCKAESMDIKIPSNDIQLPGSQEANDLDEMHANLNKVAPEIPGPMSGRNDEDARNRRGT